MWLEGSVLCAGGGDRTGKGRDGLPASTWRALGAAVLQCVHVLCVCVQAAAASRRPTFCVCVCVFSVAGTNLSLSHPLVHAYVTPEMNAAHREGGRRRWV